MWKFKKAFFILLCSLYNNKKGTVHPISSINKHSWILLNSMCKLHSKYRRRQHKSEVNNFHFIFFISSENLFFAFRKKIPTHDKRKQKKFFSTVWREAPGWNEKKIEKHSKPEFSSDIHFQLIAKNQTVNIGWKGKFGALFIVIFSIFILFATSSVHQVFLFTLCRRKWVEILWKESRSILVNKAKI